jgi:hypothetical protein
VDDLERWQVGVSPEAVLEEPSVTSGLVSRLVPIEVGPEPLSTIAEVIGLDGEPEVNEEGEWQVVDRRGFHLSLGIVGGDPHIPRLRGTRNRTKAPAGWLGLEPAEAWRRRPADGAARFASAVDLVERIGITHGRWELPDESDWGWGIWFGPSVDGLGVGYASRSDPTWWTLRMDKAHPDMPVLGSVSGRMADIEPVDQLSLRGAWASLDAALAGHDHRAQITSGTVGPAERRVDGVRMELAEHRYLGPDGQWFTYLVPGYVFTGWIAESGEPPKRHGGLLFLPAVDFDPSEPARLT